MTASREPASAGHPGGGGDTIPADDVRAPDQSDVPPARRSIGESLLADGPNGQGMLQRPGDVLRRPGDAHRGDARGAPDISSANVGPGETDEPPTPPGLLAPPAPTDAVLESREDPPSP